MDRPTDAQYRFPEGTQLLLQLPLCRLALFVFSLKPVEAGFDLLRRDPVNSVR
jgi:hypothetical protein